MAAPAHTRLTYDDLGSFPDDRLRREIIGGELFVTPAPRVRHQDVVVRIVARLFAYAEQHGGRVYPAPLDVVFTDSDVVEPDVLYVAPWNLERLEERFVRGAPDIVVEVSSPSTRRLELVRKRDLYERHRVPDYWYVDLDADRLELYRLGQERRYGVPTLLGRGDALASPQVPGLELSIDDILGPPE